MDLFNILHSLYPTFLQVCCAILQPHWQRNEDLQSHSYKLSLELFATPFNIVRCFPRDHMRDISNVFSSGVFTGTLEFPLLYNLIQIV